MSDKTTVGEGREIAVRLLKEFHEYGKEWFGKRPAYWYLGRDEYRYLATYLMSKPETRAFVPTGIEPEHTVLTFAGVMIFKKLSQPEYEKQDVCVRCNSTVNYHRQGRWL